jgi:flagellar basal-body rod modification protein FlgD
METTALNSASLAGKSANSAAASAKKSVISSDFNTFLTMLTTQIKNQDPTNPMDSADFAVQLATFSGVEQQVKTNDALAALSSQFGVMGMSQLAAWVGQEARAPSPVYLDDAPVTLTYNSATGADRAVLSVKNEMGTVVARENVPPGKGPHVWGGMAADGTPLPKGKYALTLESYKGDTQIGAATQVEAYSRIQEARSGANGTVLVLDGGIEVAATAVTALRVASDVQANRQAGNMAQNASNTAIVPQNSAVQAQSAPPAQETPAPPSSQPKTQPEPETYKPD